MVQFAIFFLCGKQYRDLTTAVLLQLLEYFQLLAIGLNKTHTSVVFRLIEMTFLILPRVEAGLV
jgi:hypothetical protein